MKLCIFVGANVGGAVAWSVCERFGMMLAFLAGAVGSLLGVYAGWRLARHCLE